MRGRSRLPFPAERRTSRSPCAPARSGWWSLTVVSMPEKSAARLGMAFCRKRGDIALGGQVEIALAGGRDGGPGGVVQVARRLATLGAGAQAAKKASNDRGDAEDARCGCGRQIHRDSAFTFIELERPGPVYACFSHLLRFRAARKWLTAIDLSMAPLRAIASNVCKRVV